MVFPFLMIIDHKTSIYRWFSHVFPLAHDLTTPFSSMMFPANWNRGRQQRKSGPSELLDRNRSVDGCQKFRYLCDVYVDYVQKIYLSSASSEFELSQSYFWRQLGSFWTGRSHLAFRNVSMSWGLGGGEANLGDFVGISASPHGFQCPSAIGRPSAPDWNWDAVKC